MWASEPLNNGSVSSARRNVRQEAEGWAETGNGRQPSLGALLRLCLQGPMPAGPAGGWWAPWGARVGPLPGSLAEPAQVRSLRAWIATRFPRALGRLVLPSARGSEDCEAGKHEFRSRCFSLLCLPPPLPLSCVCKPPPSPRLSG